MIFLEEHNRLSSRDSGDIENNMGTFYHWAECRTGGRCAVTNGATDNVRTAQRVSNFNRSLQLTR